MGPQQDARGAGGSAPGAGAQAAAPGLAKARVTDRRWGRGPACSPKTPRTAAVLRSAGDTRAGRCKLYRAEPLAPPRRERRPSPAALLRAGALARSHLPVSPAPAQPPPQPPQPAARVCRAKPRPIPPREAVPKWPRRNLARLDS